MADITPAVPAGRQLIQGYGNGGFRIAGTTHEGSVIVFADRTLPWPVASIDDLTAGSLAAVTDAAATVDVLLIGCGARMAMPSPGLRDHLRGFGIVADMMDTGAACRTFNVLLSEDRRVAAALIAVD